MSSVVVAVDGEATRRAAFSLATHPGVDQVSILAPTESRHFPRVDSPDGHDLLVGTSSSVAGAPRHQLPVVVPEDRLTVPGVYGGSPEGLALSLAVGMGDIAVVATAFPGEAGGDVDVVFPSPIDGRRAVVEHIGGHRVHRAGGEGPLGAAMVFGAGQHRVVIDDHAFLTGVALAAAAVLVLERSPGVPIPVWEDAKTYLAAVVEMGLVIGERDAAGTR